ncbi:carbonic anhydrase [Streptomyces sp. NPDC048172]|uniref:carbonic anhydrase n=1 Tax=Streptomyces sp. NPDC048172 TaxID=3365505 RepID=UPI003714F0A3
MHALLERAQTFRDRIVPHRERFSRFAAGQRPSTLFVTCSDSRVVPTLITAAEPGELFELRNAGNIVPPYQTETGSGEAATVEYAVEVLGVGDIVVCGHSHCGAVGALVRAEDLTALPCVANWVALAQPSLGPLLADATAAGTSPGSGAPAGAPPEDPALSAFVRRHVAAQLETLRGYPSIAHRLAAGRLRLHGWFYRVDTGEVRELAPGDR